MSSTSTVEISQGDDGSFRAVDSKTGTTAEAATRADALDALAKRLKVLLDDVDEVPVGTYREISARTQKRFAEKGLDRGTVDDAIEWARQE